MSKRIALIQPRIKTGTSLGIIKAPESIQALAGPLEKEHKVRMFHSAPGKELDIQLMEFDPEVVGISTMTGNFPEGRKIAEDIKSRRREILVVLGGWHASGCVEAYKSGQEEETYSEIAGEDSPFDFVISGEGDVVLPELVRRFENREPIDELAGVGLNTAERIRNLNILTNPSWNGLNIDEFRDLRTNELDLSVHFNRSCRFKCGFCATPTVYGKGVTTFSPERAVEYLKEVVSKGPQVITFTDEDFFAKLPWVRKVVALLEESAIEGVKFDTFATINDILRLDDGFLQRMHNVGFHSFTIGVESFNPRVLRGYNKEQMILPMFTADERKRYDALSEAEQDNMIVTVYFEKVQEAIKKAQKNGILIVGDYILGNLDESEEEVREGFSQFSQLEGLLMAYIPTFTPFPGTPLWEKAYKSGKLKRDKDGNIDWRTFNASEGALNLGYDIAQLRNVLEVEFYTSERYQRDLPIVLKTIPELLPMFILRFRFLKERFGDSKIVSSILDMLKKM